MLWFFFSSEEVYAYMRMALGMDRLPDRRLLCGNLQYLRLGAITG